MYLSRLQRGTVYACAFVLLVLGGWTVDTSYTTNGGMTAVTANAFLTKVAIGAALFVLAVAAKFTHRKG